MPAAIDLTTSLCKYHLDLFEALAKRDWGESMEHQRFPQHAIYRGVIRAITKTLVTPRMLMVAATSCLAMVTLAPAGWAQDVTFQKTRYSSVKQPKETDIGLTVTDSKILIKGKKENGITVEIPFSSIDSMSL